MQSVVFVLLFLFGVHGVVQFPPEQLTTTTQLLNKLQTLETKGQTLETKVLTLETEVQTLETKVQTLAQQQNGTRVAFFASLEPITKRSKVVQLGPVAVETTVKYKGVLTNVGNAYNADTGVFTAPVRGLYVFHLTGFNKYDNGTSNDLAVALVKNSGALAASLDKASDWRGVASGTRVAVVTLEPGDTVRVVMGAETRLTAVDGLSNSFSGFLIAPV